MSIRTAYATMGTLQDNRGYGSPSPGGGTYAGTFTVDRMLGRAGRLAEHLTRVGECFDPKDLVASHLRKKAWI